MDYQRDKEVNEVQAGVGRPMGRAVPSDTCNMQATACSPEEMQRWKDKRDEERLARLAHRMRYHAPRPDQLPKYQALRDAALHFAVTIARNTPDNDDSNDALRLVEHVLMTANKAIALG